MQRPVSDLEIDINELFSSLSRRFSTEDTLQEATSEESERCELPRGIQAFQRKRRNSFKDTRILVECEKEQTEKWRNLLLSQFKHSSESMVRFIGKSKRKMVLFPTTQDLSLFDDITKAAIPTFKEAATTFLKRNHSVALVKIIYGQQLDACLVYNHTEDDWAHKEVRTAHMKKLLEANMILTLSISDLDENEIFLEVVAPFKALAFEAERKEMRLPLKKEVIAKYIPNQDVRFLSDASWWTRFWNGHKKCHLDVHKRKRSAKFTLDSIQDFAKGGESIADARFDFFSPAQRNYLAYSIIAGCTARVSLPAHNGTYLRITMNHLIKHKIYKDFFALHDGRLRAHHDSQRSFLKEWSDELHPSLVPIDAIRWYYGEEFAFYFGFVSFYTQWLLIPAFLGFSAFVYGIVNTATSFSGSFISVFDNSTTCIFTFLLSIWSICFLKSWKRRCTELSFLWDQDHYKKESNIRSDWNFSHKRISPVTGIEEFYTPRAERRFKRFLGVVFMLASAALFAGTVALTVVLQGALSSFPGFSKNGSTVASTFVAVIQIFIFTPIGQSMVIWIAKFENYRKSNHFIDRIVWKEFSLCFVNCFGLLFFSSLIKPVISTISAHYKYFGLYEFQCVIDPLNGFNSCLTDLIITIAIVFGVKQFAIIAVEMLTLWYQHRQLAKKWEGRNVSETAKQSVLLNVPTLSSISENIDSYESFSIGKDSFSEFNSPIIQLGTVLLFSCAFPLAPALAWLNNTIEIKTDLAKTLIFYKRPFSQPADGIGAFTHILHAIIHLGILSQATIVAFTSDGIEHFLFQRVTSDPGYNLVIKIGFVLLFQNLLLFASAVINYTISDVPEHVRIGRLAEEHIESLREEERK